MKRNKLAASVDVDFDLLGLVCTKKEYKLAWYLNEAFRFNLQKQEDIRIEFSDRTSILISNFLYQKEYFKFELLQNRLVAAANQRHNMLVPELAQFDYLVKFYDHSEEYTSENVNEIIRGIPIVEYVMRLNFDNLKSKENLLY